jgi:hypothetical protein
MLAKITSKNQLTLPKAVAGKFSGTKYFDVTATDDEIILKPMRISQAEAVRSKLSALGITELDVAKAVKWARRAR